MTRYWIKIALGALLIFAVGLAGWLAFKKGVVTVHTVLETSDPITIPIKIVDFRVDGTSLGKVQKLTLIRTAPKQVSAVIVTARVDSLAAGEALRACTLRIDDVEKLDEHSTFVCVTGDTPSVAGEFESFGEVVIQGTDITLPLLLPAAAVRDLKNQGWQGDSMAPAPPMPPVPPAVEAGAATGAPEASVTP